MSSSLIHTNNNNNKGSIPCQKRNSKKRGRTAKYECVGDNCCDNSQEPKSKRPTLGQDSDESARKTTLQAIDNENSVAIQKNQFYDEIPTASGGKENTVVNGGANSSSVGDIRRPQSEAEEAQAAGGYRAEDFQTPENQRPPRDQPPALPRVDLHSDDHLEGQVTDTSESGDDGEFEEDVAWPTEILKFYESFKSLTFDFMTPAGLHTRWPFSFAMWNAMEQRDREYRRPQNVLHNHPRLSPFLRSDVMVKMAALSERMLCSRETFHLCVDYLDRYLSLTYDWKPSQFIIIALACLLLATRMEHKDTLNVTHLHRYAMKYLCDKRDLTRQKREVIRVLSRKLSPVTVQKWLTSFLQLAQLDTHTPEPKNLLNDVKYDRMTSYLISRLTDLCLMDDKSTQFPYKVIAASALYFHGNAELATSVSNLLLSELKPCIEWMRPFFEAIMDRGELKVKRLPGVKGEDVFQIQSSFINLPLFCRALAMRPKLAKQTIIPKTSDELHPVLACTLVHPSQVKLDSGPELGTSNGQWPSQEPIKSSAGKRSEPTGSHIRDDKKSKGKRTKR